MEGKGGRIKRYVHFSWFIGRRNKWHAERMKEKNLGMNMNFITATSTAAGNLDMGSDDDDVGREEIAESRFMTTSATFYSQFQTSF